MASLFNIAAKGFPKLRLQVDRSPSENLFTQGAPGISMTITKKLTPRNNPNFYAGHSRSHAVTFAQVLIGANFRTL
jgi:hypothetical protein